PRRGLSLLARPSVISVSSPRGLGELRPSAPASPSTRPRDQGRADQVFPPLAANTGVGPFLTAAGLRQAQGGPRTNGGRMEMDMHSRNATKAPPWKAVGCHQLDR